MATIASLRVEITADTAAFERGFRQTNALLNQLVYASDQARLPAGYAVGAVNSCGWLRRRALAIEETKAEYAARLESLEQEHIRLARQIAEAKASLKATKRDTPTPVSRALRTLTKYGPLATARDIIE